MTRAWHQRREAELVRRPAGQRVAALPHAVPGMGPLPFDRGWNGQVGGRIARPLLLVTSEEARVVAVVAPAEHEWMDVPLQLPPHIQKAGALGRTEPLVAIAGVEVRVELPYVQRQVARDVSAVDHGADAALARAAAELRDRQRQRRRRRVLAEV